jgi:hypothetical protein
MAFGKRKVREPVVPPTVPELIALHQEMAEHLLGRAGKAGRIEAETRLATMATAHATLAVSYQLAPPAPDAMPELHDDESDE